MNNTPSSYLSPLRSFAIFLSSSFSSLRLKLDLNKRDSTHLKKDTLNISTIPVFKSREGGCDDHGIPISELKELITRQLKISHIRELNSPRGKETLRKASEYNISFNEDSINWLNLMSEVKDHEQLVFNTKKIS